MIKKVLSILLLVIVGFTEFSGVAYATTQQPPSGQPTIPNVWVYESLFEPNDELYLIELNIPLPPVISLTASQTFVVNLLNGSTILGSVNPITNPYFASGYGEGVIGMYFTAAQVLSSNITFGSTNYTMTLLTTDPTPTTWNGTPPSPYTLSSITNWYSTGTQNLLKNEIIALSGQFKASWGMTQIFISSGVLTTDGQTYWEAAIPNLRLLCPIIFSGFITPITYHKPPNLSVTYALLLRSQWATSWLNLSVLAADWSIDPIWILASLWMVVVLVFTVVYIAMTQTNEGAEWVVAFALIVGSLVGFMPYSVAVFTIVLAGFSLWWSLDKRSIQ